MRRWGERAARFQPVAVLLALWPFLRQERQRLLVAAGLALVLTGIDVASPYLIGLFVDSILGQVSALPRTPLSDRGGQEIVAMLVLAALARGLVLARLRAVAGRIGEQMAARLREALWTHLARLPLDYAQQRGPGRLLLRFIGDTRAVQRFVTEGLARVTQDLLLAAAVLLALAILNWRMALAVVLVPVAYGVIFWALNPRLRRASQATRRRRARLAAYLNERIAGMKVVKAFARQRVEAGRVKALTRDLADRGARQAAAAGQLQGLTSATLVGSVALALALAAGEVAAGRVSGGTLVTFLLLVGLLAPIFQRVSTANRYLQEAQISVDRLMETLSEPPESAGDRRRPALAVTAGRIEVRRVSFAYGTGKRVLREVSLRARRGELVALVGPNGAGKSTLLDLLLRFRQPSRGRILIDGQDIERVALDSLRSQIGLVAPDTPLFAGTIGEAVGYGVEAEADLWEAQIRAAARVAGVEELVDRLPDGWETQIGEGGRLLSDGQRQRVALARALAIDPPILLLDEVSAALDAQTEQALAERLRELARDKTVIVVAHRLPTLRLADRIYVLDRGRVVEEGTHDVLLERGKVYARLFGERDQDSAVEEAAELALATDGDGAALPGGRAGVSPQP